MPVLDKTHKICTLFYIYVINSLKIILCFNVISINKEIITNLKKNRKSGIEEHSNWNEELTRPFLLKSEQRRKDKELWMSRFL